MKSYTCEGSCGDILEEDEGTYINGFFYCYVCKEYQERGVFTIQELEDEITRIEDNEEERQKLIEERWDWVAPYKWKIVRSCRTYGMEVPPWAE